ncbi:DNA replication/repair protein RecF [Formicincola oecophyllae]|uniref:DNA replication and repair protein RecF n=1 Tax=Formicincola oecophyllae TaxID=2558361 RepID=A0A4Y6UAP1_9PROT|nr:DNA replication/repair protein RecF [Formicincola oecophyllae]QDH14214.1 DNA replication/repair protein RecF [Formicincola oecophyllae]
MAQNVHISKLTLTDFRNYTRLSWRPGPGLTILTGPNGAGKTNVLEAVSLLAPGRGLRAAPLGRLAYQPPGGEGLRGGWGVAAELTVESPHGQEAITLATAVEEGQRRRQFRLDGEAVRSQADVADWFACVWQTPAMDRLCSEGAGGRRRFLDRLVVAHQPGHAREMAAHEQALAGRNRLLAAPPGTWDHDWLDALEASLSRHAVAATAARLAFLEAMAALPAPPSPPSSTRHAFPRSLLELSCPLAERLASMPALEVEEWMKATLRQNRQEDALRGYCGFGAHKAHFTLRDATTGRLGGEASSGQQKTMVLGTLLDHARLMAQVGPVRPVLLLDEPLLHLDALHREALMERLLEAGATALLTGTDRSTFAPLEGQAAFWGVETGAEGSPTLQRLPSLPTLGA